METIAQKNEKLAPELSVASAANAEALGGVRASGYLSSDIVARLSSTTIAAFSGGDEDVSCASGER